MFLHVVCPVLFWNCPDGHALHGVFVTAPSKVLNVPAAHGVPSHTPSPAVLLNVPGGHKLHCTCIFEYAGEHVIDICFSDAPAHQPLDEVHSGFEEAHVSGEMTKLFHGESMILETHASDICASSQ